LCFSRRFSSRRTKITSRYSRSSHPSSTARNICGGITRQLYVARPPTQFLDNTASPSVGRVVAIPQLGGLHHRYERKAALRPSPSHTPPARLHFPRRSCLHCDASNTQPRVVARAFDPSHAVETGGSLKPASSPSDGLLDRNTPATGPLFAMFLRDAQEVIAFFHSILRYLLMLLWTTIMAAIPMLIREE
jgi:hypothetical protein